MLITHYGPCSILSNLPVLPSVNCMLKHMKLWFLQVKNYWRVAISYGSLNPHTTIWVSYYYYLYFHSRKLRHRVFNFHKVVKPVCGRARIRTQVVLFQCLWSKPLVICLHSILISYITFSIILGNIHIRILQKRRVRHRRVICP